MLARSLAALSAAAFLPLLTTSADAQSPPPPPYGNGGGPVELRCGGEIREIAVIHDALGTAIWTAEDGGRIRHSSDGGATWAYQVTPADVSVTLIDIWFSDRNNGWACGRGGHVLRTTDGGVTWNHSSTSNPGPMLSDFQPLAPPNDTLPATLWGVDWAEPASPPGTLPTGFALGMWTFKYTDDGYDEPLPDWEDVTLWDCASNGDATPPGVDSDQFQLYDIEILHDPADATHWIGFAIGQRFPPGPSSAEKGAVVFYTDNQATGAGSGAHWWLIHELTLDSTNAIMKDAWELEFEEGSSSLSASTGYLVGGHGIASGHFFSLKHAGLQTNARCDVAWSLTEESVTPPSVGPAGASEIYAVAALDQGEAIAVGYAGDIWERHPNGSGPATWHYKPINLLRFPTAQNTNNKSVIKVPLECVDAAPLNDGSGEHTIAIGGSFGVLRGNSTNFSADPNCPTDPADPDDTYEHLNSPQYTCTAPENPWRMNSTFFWNDLDGIVVGQFQLIAKTYDGGITWDRIQGGEGGGLSNDVLEAVEFGSGSSSNLGVVCSDQDSGNGMSDSISYSSDSGATWSVGALPSNLATLSNLEVSLSDLSWKANDDFVCVGRYTSIKNSSPLPLIMESSDGGATWSLHPVPSTSLSQPLELTRIHIESGGKQFVSGHSGGVPQIFAWDSAGWSGWNDVSPAYSGSVDQRIRDLFSDGNGRYVAAGNNASIYYYDVVTNRFESMALTTSGSSVLSVECNFQSVALAGDDLVIGMEPWIGSIYFNVTSYDSSDPVTYPSLINPENIGLLIHGDVSSWPSAQSCVKVKALTNDGIIDIFPSSSSNLYMLGAPLKEVVDPEVGSVSDFVLLRYPL